MPTRSWRFARIPSWCAQGWRRVLRDVRNSVQDQAAKDDAHLRVAGDQAGAETNARVHVELRHRVQLHQRLDGVVRQLRRRHRPGRAGDVLDLARSSWPGSSSWPSCFAELSSHFPVAGSIYQWSKRLSQPTLGWFTGWFYFWAQVVTVTAVAGHRGLRGRRDRGDGRVPRLAGAARRQRRCSRSSRSDHARASPRSSTPTASGCSRSSTTSAWRTEILGMLVFALILLFFANHQSPRC